MSNEEINNQNDEDKITPKHRDKVEALDNLSLGISIVVAILLGIALGFGLKSITGYSWTLWIGVFWGISAAIMNIYKSYKKAQKGYNELLKDPKYKYAAEHGINKTNNDD